MNVITSLIGKHHNFAWTAIAGLLSLMASAIATAGPMTVFVSIAPQKAVVTAVAGPHATVEIMVEPGANPHAYEPKPRQMQSLSSAKLYFATGVPFEHAWLPRFAATAPSMQIVHTDADIEKRAMTGHHHHEEGHEEHHPDGAHEHEGEPEAHAAESRDPHVWLSPALVILQARRVFTALAAADPAHAAEFRENYRRFAASALDLDAAIHEMLSRRKGNRFLVFHPSWGYFADAYGLEQIPIEIEGKEPKPAELARIVQEAQAGGITAIFAQRQFSRRSADAVASSIGGRVVVVDPLAEDWAGSLRDMATKLAEALK